MFEWMVCLTCVGLVTCPPWISVSLSYKLLWAGANSVFLPAFVMDTDKQGFQMMILTYKIISYCMFSWCSHLLGNFHPWKWCYEAIGLRLKPVRKRKGDLSRHCTLCVIGLNLVCEQFQSFLANCCFLISICSTQTSGWRTLKSGVRWQGSKHQHLTVLIRNKQS